VHTALKTDANGKEKYDAGANSYYPRASREDQQIYPTAWDNEWHLRSVAFNSGNKTEVTIALYGYGSKMWVDDMALYKNGDGVKYVGTNAQSELRVNYYSEVYTCADNKCANKNPGVESADYWNSGYGWDSGFLSVVSGGKSGKALKYSASAGDGMYYIKWVDVSPNTEYAFSIDAKILKSGEGRIGLLTDHMTNPTDAVYMAFDQEVYGSDWVDFCVTFNTSGFTRVGIAVCDLGGQALIDNIQLFKVSDGTPVGGDGGVDSSNPGNGGANNNGGVGGNTQNGDGTVDGGDGLVPDGDNATEDELYSDKEDKDNKKDKDTSSSFTLTGPVILAISFGGTAVLIGLGVGIYFIIRAIVKKKKAAPAAVAEIPAEDAAETPAEEPVEDAAE